MSRSRHYPGRRGGPRTHDNRAPVAREVSAVIVDGTREHDDVDPRDGTALDYVTHDYLHAWDAERTHHRRPRRKRFTRSRRRLRHAVEIYFSGLMEPGERVFIDLPIDRG